jgi:hypothetical protein
MRAKNDPGGLSLSKVVADAAPADASAAQTPRRTQFAAIDVQFDLLRSQLKAVRNLEAPADLGQSTQQKSTVGDNTAALEARNQAKALRDEARIASSQLPDKVAYSTISLALHQPALVRTTHEVDFDRASFAQRPRFATNVQRAMAGGWHSLLKAMAWGVALLGCGAVVILVAADGSDRRGDGLQISQAETVY